MESISPLIFALVNIAATILNAYGITFSVSLGLFFAAQDRQDDYYWATFIIVCFAFGTIEGGIASIRFLFKFFRSFTGGDEEGRSAEWLESLLMLAILILEIIATVHAWSWVHDLQANGPEDVAHDAKVVAILLATLLSMGGLVVGIAIILVCCMASSLNKR